MAAILCDPRKAILVRKRRLLSIFCGVLLAWSCAQDDRDAATEPHASAAGNVGASGGAFALASAGGSGVATAGTRASQDAGGGAGGRSVGSAGLPNGNSGGGKQDAGHDSSGAGSDGGAARRPGSGGAGTRNGGAVGGGGAGTRNEGAGTRNGGAAGGGGDGGSEGPGGARADAGAQAGSTRTGGSRGDTGGGGGGVGGPPDAGDASDRCDVAVYDPANAPGAFTLSGDLGTHDPALIEASGTFYLFQTGSRIPTKTSTDLKSWKSASAVFSSNPAWIASKVPGATDLWAPDISHFGGQYHLYYAASTFGRNSSCIGHATRSSLTSGSWTDQGSVICSGDGDNWNAIDAQAFVDTDGSVWLPFGSFWSGIKMVRLTTDGTRADTELLSLANRPDHGGALEGPFIVRRCGYYYLFTSWDKCCDGLNSNYNMRVVRATSVTGPYTDKSGVAAMQGGGTLLVKGNGTWIAPGHNAIVFSGKKAYNVYHALTASNAAPMLRVSEIVWDSNGWPISGGP